MTECCEARGATIPRNKERYRAEEKFSTWHLDGNPARKLVATPGHSQQPAIRRNRPRKTSSRCRKTCSDFFLLHKPLGTPRPGSWLASEKTKPETYQQYVEAGPTRATRQRSGPVDPTAGRIYAGATKIVRLTAEFLRRYYQLPVKIAEDRSFDSLPEEARRINQNTQRLQVNSLYLIDHVLHPSLPDDAAAMLALTATDLWPGENWNFVFGQRRCRNASASGRSTVSEI